MKQYQIQKLDTVVTVDGLVNVAYYKLPKNYAQPGESHNFWELVYVDKGSLVATAGGTACLLDAGEVVFHCPNEFHALHMYQEKPANIIIISFCCDSPMMAGFQQKILTLGPQEKQCLSNIVQEAEAAYTHFDNVAPSVDLALRSEAPYGCQQMIKNALEQLLILIYRQSDSIRPDTRTVTMNQLHHHAWTARQVQEYLHEHYPERITLELLADFQSISITQLKRVFREQTGQTIITYLTNLRVGEAKRLIQEGNLNFTQIAEAVGYDNIYYFSTLFKKQTGMSPTEYSKSVRR